MHDTTPQLSCLRAVRPSPPTLITALTIIACLLFSQTACSSKTVNWTEEVQLSNGQVIVVERATKHRPGGGEIFRSSGWRPQQYFIRFKYPPNSEQVIEWRSTKMDVERSTDPEFPLFLDIEPTKSTPFVISIRGLKGFCYEYVRYSYTNGAWSEDPLPAEFEPRTTNLYLPAATLDIVKNVSLQLKGTENADGRYRKRLKQVGPKQTACGA